MVDIIQRTHNVDEKGRHVGDRVIAKANGVMELEISGGALCSTHAASLEHLQWFEHR